MDQGPVGVLAGDVGTRSPGRGPPENRPAAELYRSYVTFDELRQAFAAGAPWAVSAIEESCGALAVAVISVGELLHPSLVLIGGGFAAAMPTFAATVSKHVARLARPGHPPAPIQPAVLGRLSSLRGAILVARGTVDDVGASAIHSRQ